jgi:hypothetical protein
MDKSWQEHTTDTTRTLPRTAVPGLYTYTAVWKRALFKLKLARSIKHSKHQQILYGFVPDHPLIRLRRLATLHEDDFCEDAPEGLPWYLVNPESQFSGARAVVYALMLACTAIVLPFRIGFFEVVFYDTWLLFDLTNDSLFFTDLILNCLTPYRLPDGSYERRLSKICLRYLQRWLVVDAFACFPLYLFEHYSRPSVSAADINKFVRLLRLSRYGKLVRIFAEAKTFKKIREHPAVQQLRLTMQMNSRKSLDRPCGLSQVRCRDVHSRACHGLYLVLRCQS